MPSGKQSYTWTRNGLLSTGPSLTHFSKILKKSIHFCTQNVFKHTIWKMLRVYLERGHIIFMWILSLLKLCTLKFNPQSAVILHGISSAILEYVIWINTIPLNHRYYGGSMYSFEDDTVCSLKTLLVVSGIVMIRTGSRLYIEPALESVKKGWKQCLFSIQSLSHLVSYASHHSSVYGKLMEIDIISIAQALSRQWYKLHGIVGSHADL